jgi:hypothetical protein
MAGTAIDEAYAQQYADNFILRAQQKRSRLENSVRVDTGIVGASKTVERIGSSNAQKRTTRHADSPIMDTPFDRRWLDLTDYEWGDIVDDQDKIRLMTDPTSTVVQVGVSALNRAKDDVIISALSGSARVGTGSTASTTALPAGQKIVHGGVGLTIAKLVSAKELLLTNEAINEDDPNDQLFMVVSAQQLSNLLNSTQVTSADWNTVQALVRGTIDSFMGFTFIRSQRLSKVSTTRYCYAYCKSGTVLGVGKDIVTRVQERPDKSFSVYAYAKMSLGAVRTEEEKVVEVQCTET